MAEITDRRYPIGNFEYGRDYSNNETRKHIKIIARLPKDLKKVLKKLRDGALDKPYRTGGWTARQVIHHLADGHINAYTRFKFAVTENTPTIKPFEANLWAELEDAKSGSPKVSLKLLSALHARWVDFLTSLSEEDLERNYYHPVSKRTVTLREAIALFAWHSRHHLGHIKIVVSGNFEKASDSKRSSQTDEINKRIAPIANVSIEAGAKPKRVMTEEHKAKIRAGQMARRGAEKTDKPSPAIISVPDAPKRRGRPAAKPVSFPKPSSEKPKRTRRSSAEVAAEKVAKAAAPKLSRAEVLAKARAARATTGKAAPSKTTTVGKGKRGRPKSTESQGIITKNPMFQPKGASSGKAKRTRRSSAEVAAEKAAKASVPKLSRAEALAKARSARTKTTSSTSNSKKDSNAPKLTRAEAMAKARAARGKKA